MPYRIVYYLMIKLMKNLYLFMMKLTDGKMNMIVKFSPLCIWKIYQFQYRLFDKDAIKRRLR